MKSLGNTFESSYAKEAIKRCRKKGAKIAIATAQSDWAMNHPHQQKFLKSLGIKDSDVKFARYQGQKPDIYGSYKSNMLDKILKNVKNRNRVIFFDDLSENIKVGNMKGIKGELVSKNCYGGHCTEATGITKKDFENGMKKVNNKPEMCIFDIDHTLTRGNKSINEKYRKKCNNKNVWIYILLFLIPIIIFLCFLIK